jgi:hypothetical protein
MQILPSDSKKSLWDSRTTATLKPLKNSFIRPTTRVRGLFTTAMFAIN